MELEPRYVPNTYKSISRWNSHCTIGTGIGHQMNLTASRGSVVLSDYKRMHTHQALTAKPMTANHLQPTSYNPPLTANPLQPTTDSQPMTANQWQPTSDSQPLTANHWQSTTYIQPLTANLWQPTTYSQALTANHWQPTPYSQPLTSNHLQPTSDSQLLTANHWQPTTDSQPLTTNHWQPTSDSQPLTANPIQPTSDSQPLTAILWQPTTDSQPLTAKLWQPTTDSQPLTANHRHFWRIKKKKCNIAILSSVFSVHKVTQTIILTCVFLSPIWLEREITFTETDTFYTQCWLLEDAIKTVSIFLYSGWLSLYRNMFILPEACS